MCLRDSSGLFVGQMSHTLKEQLPMNQSGMLLGIFRNFILHGIEDGFPVSESRMYGTRVNYGFGILTALN